MKVTLFLLTCLFVTGLQAHACSYDLDCQTGSRCIKSDDEMEGVCAGGLNPGNENDDNPYHDADGGTKGDMCSYNTECDPGQSCLKDGHIDGVCF